MICQEEACMHTDGCGKLVSPYDGYGSIRRKGVMGDLVIAPAFMPEQFDAQEMQK